MRVALLVAVAACNQIYSLDSTSIRTDARTIVCPPIGETPQFDSTLRQAFARSCIGYSFLPPYRTAIALCNSSASAPLDLRIELGTANVDDLTPTGLPVMSVLDRHIARLGHDGEHIYAQEQGRMRIYRRAGDAWQYEEDLPQFTLYGVLAPLVNDNGRDRAIVGVEDRTKLVELVREATWTEVAVHPAAELGATSIRNLAVTSDGLRILYVSEDDVYRYSDRPRLDAPFRIGTKLEGFARNAEAFMTDDCARVYVAGVGSVFYAEQR